jgi:hypothetical protein
MATIVIAEVHPLLDGEYEFEATGFTNFELHAVKRTTGITAGEFSDAYERMDNDIIVALSMVALMRAGKITSRTPWSSPEVEALWNAPVGAIHLSEDEESDADPPALSDSANEPPSEDAEKNDSSGESSSSTSGLLASAPSRTGGPT